MCLVTSCCWGKKALENTFLSIKRSPSVRLQNPLSTLIQHSEAEGRKLFYTSLSRVLWIIRLNGEILTLFRCPWHFHFSTHINLLFCFFADRRSPRHKNLLPFPPNRCALISTFFSFTHEKHTANMAHEMHSAKCVPGWPAPKNARPRWPWIILIEANRKEREIIIPLRCQAVFVVLIEMAEKTIKQRADYRLDAVSARQLDRWKIGGGFVVNTRWKERSKNDTQSLLRHCAWSRAMNRLNRGF